MKLLYGACRSESRGFPENFSNFPVTRTFGSALLVSQPDFGSGARTFDSFLPSQIALPQRSTHFPHMQPVCYYAGGMTNTTEVTTTLRLRSRELLDALREHADSDDRSLNYVINDAIEEYLGARAPKVTFPECDHRGTYQATIRWTMPGFDGDPEQGQPNTEHTIDRMMSEVCQVIRQHGADDLIQVDGPIGIMPMAKQSKASAD